jgi:hypothetical protein
MAGKRKVKTWEEKDKEWKRLLQACSEVTKG